MQLPHASFLALLRPSCPSLVCRPDSGAGGGWHPALDAGLDQSMTAESTLIYPKARPLAAPASLRKSSASLRPEGQLSVGPSVLNTIECMLISFAASTCAS